MQGGFQSQQFTSVESAGTFGGAGAGHQLVLRPQGGGTMWRSDRPAAKSPKAGRVPQRDKVADFHAKIRRGDRRFG